MTKQFCVFDKNQKKAPFYDDSGSGIVCRYGNNWIMTGVHSFGSNQPTRWPTVGARISMYTDWIKSVITTDCKETSEYCTADTDTCASAWSKCQRDMEKLVMTTNN
ncbi:hypothetical protein Ciccas_007076 [Cichlidogyrus casuarinus]|uniref:Peptidase S1 domain-containing protein n=1 Tax=Cichlidogyrus casuarinus TaxID=1844966 RepID=A0ABD2Q6G5_9PLAT